MSEVYMKEPREIFLHLAVGPGWATLAVKRDVLRSGIAYAGISWCAPGDQYERRRGRERAQGRRVAVTMHAALGMNYKGAGFIFTASASHRLDAEAAEALGAWLQHCREQARITHRAQTVPGGIIAELDAWHIPRWLDLPMHQSPVISPRRPLRRAQVVPLTPDTF